MSPEVEVASVLSPGTHLAPPSAEELAAIVAAIELSWPAPQAVGGGPGAAPMPRWRFSGRWWTKPIPTRRDRPA